MSFVKNVKMYDSINKLQTFDSTALGKILYIRSLYIYNNYVYISQ